MDRLIALVLLACLMIWHSGHGDKAALLLGVAVVLGFLRYLMYRE
jgi:hypothetical protein